MFLNKASRKVLVAAFLASSVCSSGVYAFGLGDIKKPSLGGDGAASAPAQNMNDVVNTQEGIVKRYVSAASSINMAQLKLAEALGLKDQIASLQDQQKVFDSGAVLDKDALEKAKKTSSAADQAINKRLDEESELSDEAKEKFAESLIPYAQGLAGTKALTEEFSPFLSAATAQINAASLTDKMKVKGKLETGMYIATETPGLLKNLMATTSKLLDYAKSRNIKTPKEATDLI